MVTLNKVVLTPEVQEVVDRMMNREAARCYKALELLGRNGTNLREPHVKKVRGKMWELRYKWNKMSIRMFYFTPERGTFVILHMISKKTNKTPSEVIATAERRMSAYQERAMNEEQRGYDRFPIPAPPKSIQIKGTTLKPHTVTDIGWRRSKSPPSA